MSLDGNWSSFHQTYGGEGNCYRNRSILRSERTNRNNTRYCAQDLLVQKCVEYLLSNEMHLEKDLEVIEPLMLVVAWTLRKFSEQIRFIDDHVRHDSS